MEKKFIEDKQGNKVLPYTHMSAVLDDNGNDMNSVMGSFEDEVRGLVRTPHQNYVTVVATSSTTTSNLATLINTQAGSDMQKEDTIYRVSNWNGSSYDVTTYSEYAWSGSDYIFLCQKTQIGEVFDITVYNNNTKYADLAAALGNNGANVPATLRKGGMSVKYVDSNDHKYVQYRLMSDSFNTTVANWQGVDDEPTAESENLVKSGGVYPLKFADKVTEIQFSETNSYIDLAVGVGNAVNLTPTSKSDYKYGIIDVKENDIILITGRGGNAPKLWGFIDANNILLKVANSYANATDYLIVVPENATKFIMNVNTGYSYSGVVMDSESILAQTKKELKSDLNEVKGVLGAEIVKDWSDTDKGINLAVGVGNVVDLTAITATNYQYDIIDVQAGDLAIITGKGGRDVRLWGFVDVNNIMLQSAPFYATVEDYFLVAPENAAKLIVNVNTTLTYNVIFVSKNSVLQKFKTSISNDFSAQITALENRLNTKINGVADIEEGQWSDLYFSILLNVGIGNVVNLTPVTQSSKFKHSIIDVNENDLILLSGRGGLNPRLWGFIDSNNVLLDVANPQVLEKDLLLEVPTGASKLVLNVLTASAPYYVYKISYASILAKTTERLNNEINRINDKLDNDDVVYDSFLAYLSSIWGSEYGVRVEYFVETLYSVGLPIYPLSMTLSKDVVPKEKRETYIFPVKTGDTYNITTYKCEDYSPIVFTDRNFVILSKETSGTNGQSNTYNVVVPNNAAFMFVYRYVDENYNFSISDFKISNCTLYPKTIFSTPYNIKTKSLDYMCYMYFWIRPEADRYINGTLDLTAIGFTNNMGFCGAAVRDNTTGVYTTHALQLRKEDADHNNASVRWEDDGTLIVSYGSGHSQSQYFYISVIKNPQSLNAEITTYTYDMGDTNTTSYSQYIHVGGYRYFLLRCTNKGMTILKINENDYNDYTIHFTNLNWYFIAVGVEESNTLYRIVFAKNPEFTVNIRQIFLDFSIFKVVDINGNILGDVEDIRTIVASVEPLVSPDENYNSLRLLDAGYSSKYETYFTYGKYNITEQDTGDDNGEGKYCYYYNGTIIELDSIGLYWYPKSHYFAGAAICNISNNFVIYGKKTHERSTLYSVLINNGQISKKSILQESQNWLIRPCFINNDVTKLLYVEGDVTPDDEAFWHKMRTSIKMKDIVVEL